MENKDKLVLADGTEVNIEPGCNLNAINAIFADVESFCETSKKFTEENLKTVMFSNSNGVMYAEYKDLVFNNASYSQEGGEVLGTFSLREKTEGELLKAEIAMLTECILEMSEVVYGG